MQKKKQRIFVKDIDSEFAKEFKLFLQSTPTLNYNPDKPTTRKNLSPTSIRTYWIRFAVVINDAVTDGVINEHPFRNVEPPKKAPKEPKRVLTPKEIEQLKATPCPLPQLKEAFLFACGTGLRASEINVLKWKNIVSRDGGIYLELKQPKTDHTIVIRLKNQLVYLGEEMEENEKIFKGLRYDGQTNEVLKRWCAEAGIKEPFKITSHVARHTFSVNMIKNEVPIIYVSQILGHKDIRTTQRCYFHYLPKDSDKYMLNSVNFV